MREHFRARCALFATLLCSETVKLTQARRPVHALTKPCLCCGNLNVLFVQSLPRATVPVQDIRVSIIFDIAHGVTFNDKIPGTVCQAQNLLEGPSSSLECEIILALCSL